MQLLIILLYSLIAVRPVSKKTENINNVEFEIKIYKILETFLLKNKKCYDRKMK